MERVPTPKDLRGAAAVAQALAYVAGLAGVAAGALLYRDGQTAYALVAWLVTFALGCGLMLAAFVTRAIAGLLGRVAHMEQDLAVLVARGRDSTPRPDPDPWARHRSPY